MDSVSQKVGVRCGGADDFFFGDVRGAGLEDFLLEAVFLPLEPLLGGDLGFLTGMEI